MLNLEVRCPLFCEMIKEIRARRAFIEALPDDQKSTMGVYWIRCLVNGKMYIGSTVNVGRRWSRYRTDLNMYEHHSCQLQKEWNEYGSKAFAWEVLEYVYNSSVLGVLEDEYIERFKSANPRFGYNLKLSSDRHSEETRRKMSEAHRGKRHSEETKQKMSQSQIGKHCDSEETKQRRRKAQLGKKSSEESKQKNRKAHLGKKHSEETKRKTSKSLSGRGRSEETKHKIRESHLGMKHTEETKQKMREAWIRRKMRNALEDEFSQMISGTTQAEALKEATP